MRGVALVVVVLLATVGVPTTPAGATYQTGANPVGPADGPRSAGVGPQGSPPAAVVSDAGAVAGTTGDELQEGPVRRGVAAGVAANATPETADAVTVRLELNRTPDRPGEIRVTLRPSAAARDAALSVFLSERATVVNATGFDRRGDRFIANRSDGPATLSYRLAVNRTVAGGEFEAVDVGPWALVHTPSPTLAADGATVERRYAIDGEGVLGGGLAYLGPHETHTRTVAGERIDLVVPAAADLASDPEAVVEAVAQASRSTTVGARSERVLLVAAPTTVDWAYAAQQVGAADAWVRADQSLYEPRNAWLHEYVHTRQSFRTTPETRWLYEGTATYYAALHALRQGLVDFDAFRRHFLAGTASDASRAVLADPETWRDSRAEYTKGALVVADLDRRIRLATDGQRSFAWVIARMNERDGRVDAGTFASLVARAGGPGARAAAREYTTTHVAPDPWRARQHRAAFGWTPPRVSLELTDLEAVGPGGVRHLDTDDDGLVVATNERLVASVAAENAGDRGAMFVAPYRVNFTAVNRTVGRVGAGERTTETVSHTFEEPGTYFVVVAGDAVRVRVVEPARSVAVTDVDVARTEPGSDGRVRVVARISNRDDRPARVSLPLSIDGRVRETRTVAVGPDRVRRVEALLSLGRPGEHEIGVAGERTRVTVGPDGDVTIRSRTVPDAGTAAEDPSPAAISRDGLSWLLGVVLAGAVVVGRRWA